MSSMAARLSSTSPGGFRRLRRISAYSSLLGQFLVHRLEREFSIAARLARLDNLVQHSERSALIGTNHHGARQLVAGFELLICSPRNKQAGLRFVGNVAGHIADQLAVNAQLTVRIDIQNEQIF